MTTPTTKCPSCASLEAENAILRAILEDEREANIHLQRQIASIAAANIPVKDKSDAIL